MTKAFGILFILTGVFAIAGGLYTWGDGNIFSQTELLTVLIPWADIILTGPISLVCGYGIINNLNWGRDFGLITSGIYIFGSLLVFITIFWNNDYSVFLITPSISGFLIGASYVTITIKERAIN
jgi:uncharacterized membrane protein (DUF2068 family)